VELPKLTFPGYNFKIESAPLSAQSPKIFDIVRKRFVALTPEEWVRQHLLHFLMNERKYPQSLISVEKKLLVNNLKKRTDVVLYSSSLKPLLIAECKAPSIKLNQLTFDQAARYDENARVAIRATRSGTLKLAALGRKSTPLRHALGSRSSMKGRSAPLRTRSRD